MADRDPDDYAIKVFLQALNDPEFCLKLDLLLREKAQSEPAPEPSELEQQLSVAIDALNDGDAPDEVLVWADVLLGLVSPQISDATGKVRMSLAGAYHRGFAVSLAGAAKGGRYRTMSRRGLGQLSHSTSTSVYWLSGRAWNTVEVRRTRSHSASAFDD